MIQTAHALKCMCSYTGSAIWGTPLCTLYKQSFSAAWHLLVLVLLAAAATRPQSCRCAGAQSMHAHAVGAAYDPQQAAVVSPLRLGITLLQLQLLLKPIKAGHTSIVCCAPSAIPSSTLWMHSAHASSTVVANDSGWCDRNTCTKQQVVTRAATMACTSGQMRAIRQPLQCCGRIHYKTTTLHFQASKLTNSNPVLASWLCQIR